MLKERAFGLSGNQGNRGADVKECYFYLDATPSHAWLHYLYKYPQCAFPYTRLVEENARRSRQELPFGLIDSGAFADGHYWDVEVLYAKATPDQLHIRILATNWGPGTAWAVKAEHPTLGSYALYGRQQAVPLYTENESNQARLWGSPNASPYVKDAFHRYLAQGEHTAVKPQPQGTKFGAVHQLTVLPGQTGMIPAFPADSPHQTDPHWRDLLLFHEYFHGETGQGLEASHQTGWSGLVANLVMRRYHQDIPELWRE